MKVDSEDSRWTTQLQEPIFDESLGRTVSPQESETFLAAVSRKYRSDYLTATDPHDEAECGFAWPHSEIPMRTVMVDEVHDGRVEDSSSKPAHV